MAGGDGGFVRFENISSSDVVVVGRAANAVDFRRVFPRCGAVAGRLIVQFSYWRFFKAKLLGRTAFWSDIKEHNDAVEYLRGLKTGDEIFVSDMGSGMYPVGDCAKRVYALQMVVDKQGKFIGIEGYRNY